VSANGQGLSVDDGSGRGILTGAIEGSYALLSRMESDGPYTLRLSIEEGRLIGSARKVVDSGGCTGTEFEFSFEGDELSRSCAEAGGPFHGSWTLTETSRNDGCGLSTQLDACIRLFQNGSQVYFVGEGPGGTVSGNTLSVHEVFESVEEDLRIIIDQSVQLVGGGSSITVTSSITFQSISNPQESCTTSVTASGVPAAQECPIDYFKQGSGTKLVGLEMSDFERR
jgi:hypothetical protein